MPDLFSLDILSYIELGEEPSNHGLKMKQCLLFACTILMGCTGIKHRGGRDFQEDHTTPMTKNTEIAIMSTQAPGLESSYRSEAKDLHIYKVFSKILSKEVEMWAYDTPSIWEQDGYEKIYIPLDRQSISENTGMACWINSSLTKEDIANEAEKQFKDKDGKFYLNKSVEDGETRYWEYIAYKKNNFHYYTSVIKIREKRFSKKTDKTLICAHIGKGYRASIITIMNQIYDQYKTHIK